MILNNYDPKGITNSSLLEYLLPNVLISMGCQHTLELVKHRVSLHRIARSVHGKFNYVTVNFEKTQHVADLLGICTQHLCLMCPLK